MHMHNVQMYLQYPNSSDVKFCLCIISVAYFFFTPLFHAIFPSLSPSLPLSLPLYQLWKDMELRGQLEQLKCELAPLEKKYLKLVEQSSKHRDMMVWGGVSTVQLASITKPLSLKCTCACVLEGYIVLLEL